MLVTSVLTEPEQVVVDRLVRALIDGDLAVAAVCEEELDRRDNTVQFVRLRRDQAGGFGPNRAVHDPLHPTLACLAETQGATGGVCPYDPMSPSQTRVGLALHWLIGFHRRHTAGPTS